MTCPGSTVICLPHQFCVREFSMSRRVTFGFVPLMLFDSENMPCSPEAKWVVWPRHSAHCSDVAQAPARKATPISATAMTIFEPISVTSCDDVELRAIQALTMIRNACAPSQPLFWPSVDPRRFCSCGDRRHQASSRKDSPHAVDRSTGDIRGAGRAPAAHPDHGVLRVERRRGVCDDRGALSGPALALAAAREHRPG